MQRMFLASVTIALAAISAPVVVHAQGQQPTFATTKVTDNIYYFRYQGHQAMFIVTPAGVIATDPISENRPAAEAYFAEIRKITQAPIRYVVYSHHDPGRQGVVRRDGPQPGSMGADCARADLRGVGWKRECRAHPHDGRERANR